MPKAATGGSASPRGEVMADGRLGPGEVEGKAADLRRRRTRCGDHREPDVGPADVAHQAGKVLRRDVLHVRAPCAAGL